MLIFVEIKVKVFLLKGVKRASIYGQNYRVKHLPIDERYGKLLTKETLRFNLKLNNSFFSNCGMSNCHVLPIN